jgi:hypothetical protein
MASHFRTQHLSLDVVRRMRDSSLPVRLCRRPEFSRVRQSFAIRCGLERLAALPVLAGVQARVYLSTRGRTGITHQHLVGLPQFCRRDPAGDSVQADASRYIFTETGSNTRPVFPSQDIGLRFVRKEMQSLLRPLQTADLRQTFDPDKWNQFQMS